MIKSSTLLYSLLLLIPITLLSQNLNTKQNRFLEKYAQNIHQNFQKSLIPTIVKNIIILFFFFLSFSAFAQTEHIILPSEVNPNGATPDHEHYVYLEESVEAQNKLFLFLPGTGGQPFHYRKILRAAADLGYHAIGLTYPNEKAINVVCALTLDTTCHSRARLEIFDGEDRHNNIEVDVDNSIQTRIIKLLQYLEEQYPSENWGQYLEGDAIVWEKIVVSGHSQGGGHAGIISKIKKVCRAVMFAANDRIPLLNRNADWITWEGLTPEDRYFGFTHENDEAVDFGNIQISWENYGMFEYGDLVLVDSISTPYENSRTLYTKITPAFNPNKFHNAVVVDLHTPMQGGVPVLLPVWNYLIDCPEQSTGTDDVDYFSKSIIYPNPFQEVIHIKGGHSNQTFSLSNIQGQLIQKDALKEVIYTNDLSPGIYFLTLFDLSQNVVATHKLIKY